MNAQLTVEDIAGQPVAVEYVGNGNVAQGEDLDNVLSLTIELDVDTAQVSAAVGDAEPAEIEGGADVAGALLAEGQLPFFDDEFPIHAQVEAADDGEEAGKELAPDPRLAEMQDVLVTLRDSEISHALRLLRQKFPHIPFPFRVRALMAARHGALAA